MASWYRHASSALSPWACRHSMRAPSAPPHGAGRGSHTTGLRSEHTVAVRIRLLRMGKIRNPQYRIVVADARTKRDGRAIEYIGVYHPKEEPSHIEVNSERAQYWLSVGAQPSEPVLRILEKTGDWQKFKGLPAPEPLKVAPARADRKARYEAESQAAAGLTPPAETKPAKKAAKKAAAAESSTEEPAVADAGTQA